ncbi:uncharacterized protein PV09_02476 [Verruconis gallopava]|uniref:Uncharacterized protein n=1 Tax=Verruconis gallopava TaxID=253628 RepID=A0A0D1XVF4_9PEZI|nr:uncharacterized protein PV09_02476 [Verruconis gallopava]KIW06796.1 hypothetical protein PV09_02476 [Verruconis gallopava]
MVLEAAFDDASPSSDFDTYSSGSGSSQASNAVQIDLSKASRPFPILGPLTGFGNRQLLKMTADIVRSAPRIIQRPLTQEEVDAVVASVSKYQQVHSWIYCNGLILGGLRAQSTRAAMEFPMKKAFKSMSIDFNSFGPLKGPLSSAAWNAVRTTLWLAWYGLPAYVIGGVAGQVMMAQKQMSDERLKQFHRDMQSDIAKRRLGEVVHRRQQGLPTDPVQQSDGQVHDVEDMSPQFGSDATLNSSYDTVRRPSNDYVQPSSTNMSSEPVIGRPQIDQGRYQDQRQGELPPLGTPEQQRAQISTAGSAWDRVRRQAGQTESAWERVRRQASGSGEPSSVPSSQWPPPRNSVPLTDSFTFDEREEDRQLAKSEAQQEFDARVERERQGKDFDDVRSSGRRW